MPTDVLIRDATPPDGPVLARIHTGARAAAMPWLAVVHTEAETERWMADAVLPHQRVRVAAMGGEIIGFAATTDGWLEQLYVEPAHQRRGVGSQLLNDALAATARPLRFWVFQRNGAARRFYERHGCRLVQLTEGGDNEEREPDALYECPAPVRPGSSGN